MHAEMANVRNHADAALAELTSVREREQALLQRRVEVLERQFREGIADLEQRFLLQVVCPPRLCLDVGVLCCDACMHRMQGSRMAAEPARRRST
jgi:hypothetical protein